MKRAGRYSTLPVMSEAAVSLRDFTRSQFGLDADESSSPHPRQHRQWWETHTAIIVLLILAILGAFATTGLSAGYGASILDKLKDCCHNIREDIATLSALLTQYYDALVVLLGNLSALLTTYYNNIVGYFTTVINNEETIIDLLESPPSWAWKCATGYALPAPNCIELTQAMLPLTVPLATSGACYVLQSDLVWTNPSSSVYAIDWYGGGGALYGCGHTLSSTQPTGRAVRIVGNISNTPSFYGSRGELAIYDMTFNGPTEFYNNDNRGVYSFRGARTRLFNVKTINWHYGTVAIAASLEEYNCNHTVFVDATSAYRVSSWLADTWDSQHTGSRCQSSNCKYVDSNAWYTIKTVPNGTIDYSQAAFYDFFAGFWGDYNPNGIELDQGQPTVMHVERCTSTGTEPFWFNRVGRGFLLDSSAKIAPAYPPADPAYTNWQQNSYGVRLGCGVSTNVVVDGLNVDARQIGEWSGFAYAFWLVGTEGQVIKNVNVYGHMPITNLMAQGFPNARRNGLITIEPIDDTVSYEPAQLINVNVKADDAETIGMAVNLQAFTTTHGPNTCYGARSTISIKDSAFIGGAAGIAIGSQQRHLLSVDNSVFEGSYYGIYAFNTSSNLVFKNNDFARSCAAIRLESGVGNTIVRDNNFVGNNFDLDDNSGAAVEVGSLSAGTLFLPCNTTAAPNIWDQSLIIPCPMIASAPSGRGTEPIVE